MAKKKKAKRTTSRRRRSVGALALSPTSPLVKFGSIAVGYFMGDKLNEAIDKAAGDKLDTKIIAGAQLGLGALLALKKGGRPSLIKSVVGGVMLGAGAKRGMGAFGIGNVSGISDIPMIGSRSVPRLGTRRIGAVAPGGAMTPDRIAMAGGGVR